MVKVEEMLKAFGEGELKDFLKTSRLLTDDLSLELIKKIGGPHSALAVTELPISKFPRDIALARLYELEESGIFTSAMKKEDDCYVRVFSATPTATRIAKMIGNI